MAVVDDTPEQATRQQEIVRQRMSLDRLRRIADALDEASPRSAVEYIREADRLVGEVILKHERDD